jgi:hypothetical protein
LETLQPASFKRKDIERQLKELGTFRNEVWKRSGEYENHRMLGDTFVAACDIDKEVVKSELAVVKQRWDKLNNGEHYSVHGTKKFSTKFILKSSVSSHCINTQCINSFIDIIQLIIYKQFVQSLN